MSLELRIPARINILGNPSDGLEGDFSTISGAVDVFAGALGVKLTSTGSGGSVFAFVNPGQKVSLMNVWCENAKQAGLNAAKVFQVRIVHHGLEIKGR